MPDQLNLLEVLLDVKQNESVNDRNKLIFLKHPADMHQHLIETKVKFHLICHLAQKNQYLLIIYIFH